MIRKNLAVLFVASMLVAASAVTTADAGVGGCRVFGCGGGGGWEAAQPSGQRSISDDILSALSLIAPRPVVESLRVLITPRDEKPSPVQAPTSPSPTTEGVGGCRGLGCGGWL